MGRVCSLLLSLLHTQGPYHKHINVTAYYRIITDRSKTLPQCPTITSFNRHAAAGIWQWERNEGILTSNLRHTADRKKVNWMGMLIHTVKGRGLF